MKRVLSVLLAAVLLLSLVPAGAVEFSLTAKAETSGYYTYTVTDGQATITDVNTAISGAVTIPSTLGGYPVTGMGERAFADCSLLTAVNFPDSITDVGRSAFNNCTALEAVYITDLAAWCEIAFANELSNPLWYADNLYLNGELVTDLVIPQGFTGVVNNAFCGCQSLVSVTIPQGVTRIGNNAFENCYNLVSLTIPDGVTAIGEDAFRYCTSLASLTIPDTVVSIEYEAFLACSSLTEVIIPDSVTTLGQGVFRRCTNLRSLTIGKNVTCLDRWVFSVCSSLTTVTIPDSVTGIEYSAFTGCTSLVSVIIPDSVTRIGEMAFQRCASLASVVIPDGVASIGYYAFEGCSALTTVTLPVSVTDIEFDAFWDCSALTDVYYGGTLADRDNITIGNSNNALINATWHYLCKHPYTTIENIKDATCTEEGYTGDTMCADCGDMLITGNAIPATGHKITAYTFANTSSYPFALSADGYYYSTNKTNSSTAAVTLTMLRDCVLVIEYFTSTEQSCDKLTITHNGTAKVTASGLTSVTSVTIQTKAGDTIDIKYTKDGSLSSGDDAVYFKLSNNTSAEEWDATCEDAVVCDVCGVTVKAALGHSVVTDAAVTPTCTTDGLTEGSHCAVCNEVLVTQEVIPATGHTYGDDNLCDVCGEDKFLSYYTYTVSAGKATITDVSESISGNVIIPSTLGGYPVTRIGDNAFSFCRSLQSVTIPNSVTSIGYQAFWFCDSLTSVTIPDSVTTIGNSAFNLCKSLTSVIIPEGVVSIGDEAFYDCTALESVTIPNSVTSIGSWAFRDCTSLMSVVVPNSVTSIGEMAFYWCTSLTSVTIGANVTSIEDAVFAGCAALTSIIIPDSVTNIGASAFGACESLESVTIPNSVMNIERSAFYNCNNLTDVYYSGAEADCANIVIGSGNDALTKAIWHYATCEHTNVTVSGYTTPTCTEDGYTGDSECADCGETIKGEVIPATGHNYGGDNLCDACGEDTMRDYYTATVADGKLTITDVDTAISGKISIPAVIDGCPVVAIGNNAFRDCKNITEITIPESIETIGNYAFRDCTALTTVYYNVVNCTSAGVNAYPVFYGCTALTTAYIGKTVKATAPRLFRGVTTLTTVYMTKNTKEVATNAFHQCEALSDLYFVGTAGEWAAVAVKSNNAPLANVAISYNAPCFDGHEWTADCDELCEFCGETRVTVHANIVEDAAKDPTCTEVGLTAGSHCEACGNVLQKQNVIPALGHIWNEGTVTVEPTYEACGYRQVTCTVCGVSELLEIPPLTRAEVRDGYYYYDGVKVPNAGLVKIYNDYYYVLAGAKVKTGRYSVFNTNGLDIPTGIYYFFEDGRMNLAAGVYEGKYYNAQGIGEAYAGLVEVDGAKYYIQSGGNVTTGRYFISKLNDLLPKKRAYTFYEDGRMLEETRIYTDGYYYENGLRTPYAGLVEYEGDYYYVADHGAYVTGKVQIVANPNNTGKQKNGRYYFDENGKMLCNVVREGRYFGADGLAPYAAGVVEVEGKLYYVGGTHGALRANATFTVSAAKTNGLCAAGKYTADANGVLTPAV